MYHADKRYDFTKNVLTGFGGGMIQDYDLAIKTVQDYESLKTTDKARYDMVAESDRRYKEVSNDVLKYMLDSERITQDAYDYITEGNRDYIAMKVIKSIDSGIHLESDGVGKNGEITSIDKNIINKINNIQVQFHDFIPKSEEMREEILNKLTITHKPTFTYKFIWEGFTKI